MELKKRQKANPNMMKELGYKRLSSTTWVKDKIKVQIIRNRIHNIQSQNNFWQHIHGFKGSGCSNLHSNQVRKCLR